MEKRIVAFSGSTRRASINQHLLIMGCDEIDTDDLDLKIISLADYEMPIYNGDYEEEYGLPDGALRLRKMVNQADALIISTPEYNASITPLLKNSIDWISRPIKNERYGSVFTDTRILLLSASPGPSRINHSISSLRQILETLDADIHSNSFSLAHASRAFDENGNFLDQELAEELRHLVHSFCNQL